MVEVKAWGKIIAKIQEQNGINYFSLSPQNKLNFSPIKLLKKGVSFEFSTLLHQKGLPGLISDSLPGVYGKQYLDEFFMKHFKTIPSYLESLQFLGDNTMGALTYEPQVEKVKDIRVNLVLDALGLYEETKKALQGEADFSMNEIIAISNSAASGARPKAIVGFNPTSEKMYIGLKSAVLPKGFTHAIVKFDNLVYGNSLEGISEKEKISHTKGEYVYSLVAKSVGINMAQTYLVESQSTTHFVTERFDINNTKNGTQRLHMHSLSGLLHHNPAETSFGYQNLFTVANKLNLPYVDKEQFFKTMLFNLIFGNTDDHSRNFSYLMNEQGDWRGAPAYDLTFTRNRKHQMMFNFMNGQDITLKHMKKFADEYRIKKSQDMIDEMIEAKYTVLKDLSIQYGLQEWYKDIISRTGNVLKS